MILVGHYLVGTSKIRIVPTASIFSAKGKRSLPGWEIVRCKQFVQQGFHRIV